MKFLGRSETQESLVSQFQTAASGQHRVNEQEGGILQIRRSHIFEVDADVLALALFAVSGHKSGISLVKDIEKPLMESQSGTQHGSNNDMVVIRRHGFHAQRCLHLLQRIAQRAAQLISHSMADALQVAPEERAIFLTVNVAELRHIAIHH